VGGGRLLISTAFIRNEKAGCIPSPFFFALFSFGKCFEGTEGHKNVTVCSLSLLNIIPPVQPRPRPLSSSYRGAVILAGRPIRQTRIALSSHAPPRTYTVITGWCIPYGLAADLSRF